MKFHICAVLLCLVQDGQALRDANEKNGKSSLPDVNETKEASCGTQCSIKKKTQLPSDVQHEVDEENNYAHQPRKRDIPNWSEKYDKDPHGHLHMGSALGMFMIALLLQWTTQPQQRKDAVASAMRKARKPRFLNQAAARADVDAEGSDSEDEATSSSDSHGTPCVMKLGPGMRFLDEDLEEEWEKESYPKNQQRGAVLLALVAFGLAVDRFYAFYELQSCKGDQWWMQKSLQIGCILVMVKVFAFLLMVPAVDTGTRGEAASFFLPSKFWDSTYWIILGFFGCFFIVVNLWPISRHPLGDGTSMQLQIRVDRQRKAGLYLARSHGVSDDPTLDAHHALRPAAVPVFSPDLPLVGLFLRGRQLALRGDLPGRRRTWWIWGFTFPCW